MASRIGDALRLERGPQIAELLPQPRDRVALRVERVLRVGAGRRGALLSLELRLQAGARRGRFRFGGGDAREIQDQMLERRLLIRLRERGFERRQPHIERGTQTVELALRGVDERAADGVRRLAG